MKQGFALHDLRTIIGKLQIEITNLLENCESTIFHDQMFFSCQTVLLALHAPSTHTATTNKHFIGVNPSLTIGIPFTE